MIRNYYTLKKITDNLKKYIGFSLVEAFTQEKGSMIIFISDGETELPLEFIGSGANDSFYVKSRFNRAKKNTIDMMENILDEIIQDVNILPNNRVIKITLINTDLYIVLFGGKNSNIYAVNHSGIIIDAFKNRDELLYTKFSLKSNHVNLFKNSDKDKKIISALSSSEFQLGKLYASEFLHRIGISPEKKMSDFSEIEIKNIENEIRQFVSILLNSDEYYIYLIDNNYTLSLVELNNKSLLEKHNDINYAVQRTIILREKQDNFQPLYKQLYNVINRLLKKYTNQLKAFENTDESVKRIEKYQNYAELLASNPKPNARAGKELNTKDWNGNEIIIPLDDKLNIIKNAEKYFDKVRRNKEDIKHREKRLPEIKEKYTLTDNAMNDLKKAENLKDLEQIKIKYKSILGLQMQNEPKQTEDKFRVFDLGEDFTLYVGKNAANNDELTMKFAKPNDLWFHVRGTSGSHAVLRLDKGQKPPKYILKKACEITAYYSGQKNAKLAPVAYTFKKFVRKPKGANPGSVVISKENVEMAKPGLPDMD